MKKSKYVTALLSLLALAFISGCALTPVAPPRGMMFTNQSAPLFPASETGSIKGSASAHNILFMVGWGDCSIKAAAEKAGIKKIKNIDYELVNVFIFYQEFTINVYGERDDAAAFPAKSSAK